MKPRAILVPNVHILTIQVERDGEPTLESRVSCNLRDCSPEDTMRKVCYLVSQVLTSRSQRFTALPKDGIEIAFTAYQRRFTCDQATFQMLIRGGPMSLEGAQGAAVLVTEPLVVRIRNAELEVAIKRVVRDEIRKARDITSEEAGRLFMLGDDTNANAIRSYADGLNKRRLQVAEFELQAAQRSLGMLRHRSNPEMSVRSPDPLEV